MKYEILPFTNDQADYMGIGGEVAPDISAEELNGLQEPMMPLLHQKPLEKQKKKRKNSDKTIAEKAIAFHFNRELVSTFVATSLCFGMMFAYKSKEDFFIPLAGATMVVGIESLRQLVGQIRGIDKRNRM